MVLKCHHFYFIRLCQVAVAFDLIIQSPKSKMTVTGSNLSWIILDWKEIVHLVSGLLHFYSTWKKKKEKKRLNLLIL